ncbi:RagB/SusD family nutrient uptake outer membrane protein [Parapedobacter sp. DT-150]|uniref:RagB/SusD family nutrient uptake outer membrane protein n=1 Tax=Parapedobacter sp. DT-150 TaxID=3396162 RepID=UPI003F197DC8
MKTTKFLLLAILTIFAACGREFLDIKRDGSQVIPRTIQDYEALFNNMNAVNYNSSHLLSAVGSDEYYLTDDDWVTLRDPYQKNGYIWASDVYQQTNVGDWDNAYHRILLANMALDGVSKISPADDENAWNRVKGTALFIRAFNYYCLAQLFCNPYDSTSASIDPGVPLRLEADITVQLGRGNVAALYDRIIRDASSSLEFLPQHSENTLLPAKQASEALLAKTYLNMGKYIEAEAHAETCIALGNGLIDFNIIDSIGYYPFPSQPYTTDRNKEVIFFSAIPNIAVTDPARLNVDTVLFGMYAENDLRRHVYFERDAEALFSGKTDKLLFKGSYCGDGPFGFFTGLALDEMYLIAAECAARLGNHTKALDRLNYLMKNRYNKDAFNPIVDQGSKALLEIIVAERRKELIFRGISWEDLRRLNKDENHKRTLYRTVQGGTYELEPLSKRYVWPIPDEEVALAALKQNER